MGEEESIYGEAPPHQLSINQSRFNYKKWRNVWAKWDGREEEDELGGVGRRTKWVVVRRGLPPILDLEKISVAHWSDAPQKSHISGAHVVRCVTESHRKLKANHWWRATPYFCGACGCMRHRKLSFSGAMAKDAPQKVA